MGEEQQFCLRWNNFQANITSQFEALRDEEDFVDVTLACDGQRIKAHKVVLSACSPYFKELFRSNPCKHPILFMRDVEFRHLQSLIEFMYAGEVNVAQAHLSSFLRTAESLQIRGLTEAPQRHKQDSKSPTETTSTINPLIQQLINPRPQSTSPRATSQNNTSSPEEEEDDNDDDMLSLSSSLSPPPAKRPREREEEENTSLPSPAVSQPTDTLHKEHETAYKEDSPELFEPKIEVPDYGSDGETKGTFIGFDSSMVDNPFATLQGGLDLLAGTSAQSFSGEPSQEALAHHQKLHSLDPRPCPICNRMYSNLSNLRQHVRLIHNPQTVACPLCSKPFKTKLYLKRHLMSFHELMLTSSGNKSSTPSQAPSPGQFFPSSQPYPGSQTEDKSNFQNTSPNKNKDQSHIAQEYFQTPRSYQNPHNGERTYNQELTAFAVNQDLKDDVANYQRPTEKSRFKEDSNSFLETIPHDSNDFQSAFASRPMEHINNDPMANNYTDATNQKTSQFLSSLSLHKSVDVPGYIASESHINNRDSNERKTSNYVGSENQINDSIKQSERVD